MPPPRAPGRNRRPRPARPARRAQRYAGLAIVVAVLVITLALTAFGAGSSPAVAEVSAVPTRLAQSGPPRPQIVALHGSLRLQLPVPQTQLTAVGYHGAGNGAVPLEPLGTRGNQGLLRRVVDWIFGAERSELVYYQLGGVGPGTSTLDVGAPPETDVFSPVDGTVVGITDVVLDGRVFGVRIDIQPAGTPSLVLSVTRVGPDPALTVGSTVVAGKTRLGTVLDLSAVEEQELARFTQDAGNHVSLEVRPAATLALP